MGVSIIESLSRASANSKRETVEQIELRAKNPSKFGQILIFPEGTNSNRKSLLKFKPGAFIPGVPVQPVLLRFEGWDTLTWTFDGTNMKILTGFKNLFIHHHRIGAFK